MKANDILNNNILISEFMGAKADDGELEGWYFGIVFPHGFDRTMDLKYHKSWDWLMTVVEKIETMILTVPHSYRRGFMKDQTTSAVSLNLFFDERSEFLGWCSYISWNGGNQIKDISERYSKKIDAYYRCVIEFIKWLNSVNPEKD